MAWLHKNSPEMHTHFRTSIHINQYHSSSIQTILSAPESHWFMLLRSRAYEEAFAASNTAGGESHSAPKTYSFVRKTL